MGEKCERATGKCTNIIHRAAWFRSFHPAPEKRPTFGSPIGCRESWQLTQKAWRTASRWSLRFRDNVLRKRSFSRRYCAAGRRAHKRFTRNSESEGSVKKIRQLNRNAVSGVSIQVQSTVVCSRAFSCVSCKSIVSCKWSQWLGRSLFYVPSWPGRWRQTRRHARQRSTLGGSPNQ